MALPTGLATIAARMDDTPHTRGAVDMAARLRRARALSALAETDADQIGMEGPLDAVNAIAAIRAQARTPAVPDRMIVDHAVLVVGAPYRSRDGRMPLSPESLEARRPLRPWLLLDAIQDRIPLPSKARVAPVVRVPRRTDGGP